MVLFPSFHVPMHISRMVLLSKDIVTLWTLFALSSCLTMSLDSSALMVFPLLSILSSHNFSCTFKCFSSWTSIFCLPELYSPRVFDCTYLVLLPPHERTNLCPCSSISVFFGYSPDPVAFISLTMSLSLTTSHIFLMLVQMMLSPSTVVYFSFLDFCPTFSSSLKSNLPDTFASSHLCPSITQIYTRKHYLQHSFLDNGVSLAPSMTPPSTLQVNYNAPSFTPIHNEHQYPARERLRT